MDFFFYLILGNHFHFVWVSLFPLVLVFACAFALRIRLSPTLLLFWIPCDYVLIHLIFNSAVESRDSLGKSVLLISLFLFVKLIILQAFIRKQVPIKRKVAALVLFYAIQMGSIIGFGLSYKKPDSSESVPAFSNIISSHDVLYVVSPKNKLYRLSQDFSWEPIADLPPGFLSPNLLANQNGIYLLGRRRQNVGLYEDNFGWELYYFNARRFEQIAGADEITELKYISITPERLLLYRPTQGHFSQTKIRGSLDLNIYEYEEKSWNGGHEEGSRKVKRLGDGYPILFHNEWFSVLQAEGNKYVAFQYDPAHPQDLKDMFWEVPPEEDLYFWQQYVHLYPLEDELYLSSASRLYRFDGTKWNLVEDLRKRFQPRGKGDLFIADLVGQNGEIFIETSDDTTKYHRLFHRGKDGNISELSFSSMMSTDLNHSLFQKGSELFFVSTRYGVYVYQQNQWRELAIAGDR